MPERNRTKDILIGAMTIAMIISSVALYVSKNKMPQAAPALTNAEEAVLQQQIVRIIASKKIADCTTLANVQYRQMCEQVLSAPVQIKGTPLQTTSAEPMTTTELQTLLKNAPSQLSPAVRIATTTP